MLYTNVSMLIGMTYVYLPFMVLPLYANLVKMDFRLLEAAYDLGTSPFKAFWLVTVSLSKAGIVAGFMLVFIPALGEFVIPSPRWTRKRHDWPGGLGRNVHQQ